MLKRMWIGLVAGVLLLLAMPHHQVEASGTTFTIAPVLRDKASQDSGYFDIMTKPGATVPLTVRITNRTKTTKTLKVSAADAYTGDNGQIGYAPGGPKDDSATVRLSDITTGTGKIKLAGGKSRRVTLYVKVPKAGIKGEVVGSFHVKDVASYGKNSTQGMTIANQYAMYSAVVLRTSNKYVSPELRLKKITVTTQTGQAAVLARLQNYKPQLFGKMTIKAKVYRVGSKKAFLTREVSDYAMAPNSHFDFGLFTKEALLPGKYELDLTAKSGVKTWHFGRKFTVSQKKADAVNKETSAKVPSAFPWWIIVIIVLLLVIIGLLLFLLWKRRKRDDDEDKTQA